MSVKGATKSVAKQLGVLENIRAVKRAVRYQVRRDWQDTRNFQLVLAARLRPDSNCVDAGGSRGDTLRMILGAAPDGQHIVVEPLPDLAEQLRDEFPVIQVAEAALSDEAGPVSFYTPAAADSGWSGLAKRGHIPDWREIIVQSVRLDDIVPEGRRIDLIKIDVEGAEVRLLRGATRVIAESRPLVWLEHSEPSAQANGTSSADLWNLMIAEHGYRLFDADGRRMTRSEFEGIDRFRMWTYLLVP